MSQILVVALLLFPVPAQAVVAIDWVTIGGPPNAADSTGYGAVPDAYRIAKSTVDLDESAPLADRLSCLDPRLAAERPHTDPTYTVTT